MLCCCACLFCSSRMSCCRSAAPGGLNVCRCEVFQSGLLLVEWKNNQGCGIAGVWVSERVFVCVRVCVYAHSTAAENRKIESPAVIWTLSACNPCRRMGRPTQPHMETHKHTHACVSDLTPFFLPARPFNP